MVAIIHNSGSLRNALHYNENKLKQGVANFIHSGNYPKDTELLGFSDKIKRLERLTALNQQTKINSVHISLNFDLSEKFGTEKLKKITDVYMQKIGFGEQPYLVYQHNDAGHPHIHIVTTNIKSDGKRIGLHNLARNESMKASKEIEKEFHLVQADKKHQLSYELKPVNVQKVQYGKAETKRAITNVLDHVLPSYKYASLAELNAVLQQYNIMADRGSEHSRIYKSRGLVYRILDANKQKVGVPIKASLIYSKPTLKNIEANFERNETERQRHKQRVINAIDLSLLKQSKKPLPGLMKALQKENIVVVLRQNDKGIIYGITYVDHQTKCVFNGSHLGKQYSANAIQQRCASEQTTLQREQSFQYSIKNESPDLTDVDIGLSKVLDDLLHPENNQYANEPPELRKFKRKRKRKQHQSHN
jgi:MobA/VirD2-like, nuclease domain